VAVREQVKRCSMPRSRWSRALGRGTYGGCVVGQDGQGLLCTLHRQVRRLLARRAASPNPDGRFEHTPLHTAARRPQHDGGIPWSVPAVLRVRVCDERAAPVVDKTISFSAPVQVGVTSSARRASPYMHIHRCASRVFSVRRTPPERPEASLNVTPLVLADASRSAAGHFAAANGPACRI
jgi:hypothetical protein